MAVSRLLVAAPIGYLLLVILVPVMILGAAGGSPPQLAGPVLCGPTAPERVGTQELTAEQMRNARHIVDVTADYRAPGFVPMGSRAAEIAIATAYQESRLRNLGYGDADSLGLFQQRISIYGADTATDPAASTTAFLDHLIQVPAWQTLPLTEVAAQVQRPAEQYRGLYAQWEPLARQLVSRLWPTAGQPTGPQSDTDGTDGCRAATSCPPTDLSVEHGLTPDAALVLRCIQASFGDHTYHGVGQRTDNPASDHPSGRAVDVMIAGWDTAAGHREGTAIASWVRDHAAELGVTYVIWDSRIWSTARTDDGWRAYNHPSGTSGPTVDHRDHVHISVAGDAATGIDTWVQPLPPDTYTLSSPYGPREDPTGRGTSFHAGLDFSAAAGTPIRAATDGTVTAAGWSGDYGNLVVVDQGNGVQTYYAHQIDGAIIVEAGDQVTAGQQIGAVGQTGRSTGPHLHFEVRIDDEPVDPFPYLADRGVTLRREP